MHSLKQMILVWSIVAAMVLGAALVVLFYIAPRFSQPEQRPPDRRVVVDDAAGKRADATVGSTASLPTGQDTVERPTTEATATTAARPEIERITMTPSHAAVNGPMLARGYLTTPNELARIAQTARNGLEPYKTAVAAELKYARNALDAEPLVAPKVIDIQSSEVEEPVYLATGSKYVYAWAIAYNLLRDSDPDLAQHYARAAHDQIIAMPRNNTQVSGYQQNTRLNISLYMQNFVFAADLLADWPLPTSGIAFGKSDDAQALKAWLGAVIIRYPYNVAHTRTNNWGAWGRLTTAVIADYVGDAAPLYVQQVVRDKRGAYIVDSKTPCDAGDVKTCVQVDAGTMYADAMRLHTDMVDGNLFEFTDLSCDTQGAQAMIRPDGGLPEELRRQYTCNATRIDDPYGKASRYSQFALEAMVSLAELAWRRGDASLYTHIAPATGRGALFRGVQFLIENHVTLTRGSMLEMVNRFYTYQVSVERDPAKRDEYRKHLGHNLPDLIKNPDGKRQWPEGAGFVSFGTLTHGFAANETPRPPPTVPPRKVAR